MVGDVFCIEHGVEFSIGARRDGGTIGFSELRQWNGWPGSGCLRRDWGVHASLDVLSKQVLECLTLLYGAGFHLTEKRIREFEGRSHGLNFLLKMRYCKDV